MYKIKQNPEDFIVNEVSTAKTTEGEYGYFILKKKNYTTQKAVERIAEFLHVPFKYIGYAGTKDRQAITTQMISIRGNYEKAKKFSLPDLELTFKGTGKEPISLGDLEGNEFEIVVRNITKAPAKIKHFVNYFDEQRFSLNNADIGKAFVKNDFKKAIALVLESNGDYEQAVRDEYEITNNPIGTLRLIPKKILQLYVHAYQSKLWNQLAEEVSKTTKENMELPIVGFGTEFTDDKIKTIAEKIMQEEGITYRDFIIRSIPELSSEGTKRSLYSEIKNLEIGKLEQDELNEGMKKVKITFFLSKGDYATMAIKNMFTESA